MKIIKYKKKKNDIYEITLENLRTIELYEDVILKYNLLLSKEIELDNKEIFDFNIECEIYHKALKFLKLRARSKKEVKDKLIKDNYDIKIIIKIVKKLEKQGYINDLLFSKSFLNNKLITTNNGPYKIRKDLHDKGISDDIINEVMNEYVDDIQQEKIKKIINTMLKSNRNKGNNVLKNKISYHLITQGFDKKIIEDLISNTIFPDDSMIAKKEYDKLYNKFSSKYSGYELEMKIKQKMFQKGFKI